MNGPAWQARVDLAAAYRIAARLGFNEGIDNHLSLEVPGAPDRYLVIPYGVHWSEITAGRLIVVDAEGRTVEGRGEIQSTAFYIHGAIHRGHPDAKCVLHAHMPCATALATLENFELLPVVQSALRFTGRVAYYRDYHGFVLDQAEAGRLVEVLGDRSVLFLANHGVLTCGPTVYQAFDDLYYVERACQVLTLAFSTGRKLQTVDPRYARDVSDMTKANAASMKLHFEAWKRILDRESPEYKQ